MKRHVMRLAIAASALSLAVCGAAAAGPAEPTVAEPTNSNAPPGAMDNFDPTYNVCRGTDPRCYHPWVDEPSEQGPAVHAHGRPAPREHRPRAGRRHEPAADRRHTSPPERARHSGWPRRACRSTGPRTSRELGNLNEYKAVIFVSTSRDTLWKHGTAVEPTLAVNTTTGAHLDAAKTNLRQYMRAGGGFVGDPQRVRHRVQLAVVRRPARQRQLLRSRPFQTGDVEIVVNGDSSTAGLPARFASQDEWYNLVPYPTKVKFLATVDEDTLATKRTVHPGHGNFHPVAWCQYYDGGRSWVTTLGHDGTRSGTARSFPARSQFKQFIVNGILSAMGNLSVLHAVAGIPFDTVTGTSSWGSRFCFVNES